MRTASIPAPCADGEGTALASATKYEVWTAAAGRRHVAGQFPVSEQFSFEQQIQAGILGNSSNGNPFSYWHGVQVRPWFHYDGIPNATLTGSASYIDYFNVPGTSDYKHPEWRVTTLGVLKQPLSGGSLYEEIRFELLNFRDSNGVSQHLPRLRSRTGQNLYLAEGETRPYLGVYEEAILQFPQPSKAPDSSQAVGSSEEIERASSWDSRRRATFRPVGSTVNLYFGPAFSIEYSFRRPMNEKHKRTTAFKDF